MISDNQKGVSLIITFFIMVIILAVVLSVSAILYSEIKVIRNIGNSIVAFYAADSGMEKLLYYDRNVFAENLSATRGLCVICQDVNPTCSPDDLGAGNTNKSIYCNDCHMNPTDTPTGGDLQPHGCDPDVCNNCEVSFKTSFGDGKDYYVWASVSPSTEQIGFTDLIIKSKGSYNNVERQIQITSIKKTAQDAIDITNACALPISVPEGEAILISAHVTSAAPGNVVITSVTANIKEDPDGDPIVGGSDLPLELQEGGSSREGDWAYEWPSISYGAYYVDITAVDELENTATVTNIPPCY